MESEARREDLAPILGCARPPNNQVTEVTSAVTSFIFLRIHRFSAPRLFLHFRAIAVRSLLALLHDKITGRALHGWAGNDIFNDALMKLSPRYLATLATPTYNSIIATKLTMIAVDPPLRAGTDVYASAIPPHLASDDCTDTTFA